MAIQREAAIETATGAEAVVRGLHPSATLRVAGNAVVRQWGNEAMREMGECWNDAMRDLARSTSRSAESAPHDGLGPGRGRSRTVCCPVFYVFYLAYVVGPPPTGKFTAVRARGDYALALRSDGRLYAWGGVIFADMSQPKNYPLPQSVWKGWTRDAAGYFFVPGPFVAFDAGIVQKPPDVLKSIPHVIAIDAAGKVTSWGADTFGEASGAPSGVQFRGVAAGNAYSLGLDTSGEIHHWGNRHEGVKLAGGTFGLGGRHLPKGPFISVSAGGHHATAIRVSRMQLHEGPDAR